MRMTEPLVFPEALVGWRAWHLQTAQRPSTSDPWAVCRHDETAQLPEEAGDGQFRLLSLNGLIRFPTEWPVGERLIAKCHHEDHRSPDPDCTCGVYAARSHRILRE